MKINSPKLIIEINKFEVNFAVIDEIVENKFDLIYSHKTPIIDNQYKLINFENIYENLKKSLFLTEQKLNFIFKESVVVIDSFEDSLTNFCSFKKLNGSQLTKQNVTYMINSLRSKIDETEINKKVIHIFNSNYILDKKRIDNLPIGLFGNFYSQELNFLLINLKNYENLVKIFKKCNLRIKKLISKSFTEGVYLINENSNLNTFCRVELKKNYSKIFFFENFSPKYIQEFNFGTNLIINDISKITNLDNQTVRSILGKSEFSRGNLSETDVEKQFFKESNFKKIKKKLIINIAEARIKEFAEIIVFKNINNSIFIQKKIPFYLAIDDRKQIKCLDKSYSFFFSQNNHFEVKFIDESIKNKMYNHINTLVQFGWKSEAVPVVQEQKSIIARIFDLFFG